MTFAEKVRLCRVNKDLTQQKLADMVGVSKRTIIAYENGDAKARERNLRKLAIALDVSTDYLSRDEITDPEYGLAKQPYVEQARGAYGDSAANEVNELLERNAALFAGGELSEEAKDAFYLAVTKAYLQCKDEAKKKYGRKKSAVH